MKRDVKKKIIIFVIFIFVFLFFGIYFIVLFDNRYFDNVIDIISINTGINNIDYVNEYDGYYIVSNNEYIYLINIEYDVITKLDKGLVYDNKNNYDIVYKDKTIMYMDNYINKDKIVLEYYDIYSYELIDKVIVGGN